MTKHDRLRKIYYEILNLSTAKKFFRGNDEYETWKTKTGIFLKDKFGEESPIYKRFSDIIFYSLDSSGFTRACSDALPTIEGYLEYMEEDMEDTKADDSLDTSTHTINTDFSQIFIVHGHDSAMRESVARLIEKQGIHPIILSDEVNSGMTIIEKIEKHANVDAAICIFSPDDIGKSKKENVERDRARQNVVLETGYFMGKLGRDKVIILTNGDLEFPSNMQGIVYTDADWKIKVLKELNQIGFKVSLSLDKL